MLKVFVEEVVPWCKENALLLLILDNDTKFHSKILVTGCKAHGIEIHPGSEKRVCNRADTVIRQGLMTGCHARLNLQMHSKKHDLILKGENRMHKRSEP